MDSKYYSSFFWVFKVSGIYSPHIIKMKGSEYMEWFCSLHPAVQALLATLFTYFVTVLGASLVFFFTDVNQKIIDVMMGSSAGVMIAASFWSLLKPAIELSEDLGKIPFLSPAIGFLVGGLFVIGSDVMMTRFTKINSKNKRNILLSTAVTLHNIPEGLVIGVAFGGIGLGASSVTVASALLLALGIGIQNFPEGTCVALPLRKSGASRFKAFFIGQASGIVEPFAGVVGAILSLVVENLLPFMLSFSAGAMIAVVCSELIPDAFKDNKVLASLGVLLGFLVMMILDVALG